MSAGQVTSHLRLGLNPRQTETVDKLLRAGEEELREVGPEALTIRMVAQRAGVSPATAYTYLASKNHLFAELFWRRIVTDGAPEPAGATAADRVRVVTRHIVELLERSPHLAAAANFALLGTDPEAERLQRVIGTEFVTRFRDAIGEPYDPRLVDTITLAFTGALLQAGMGLVTYEDLSRRLDDVVAVIMEGHER
jgi:AcrR family transcriptional regulator